MKFAKETRKEKQIAKGAWVYEYGIGLEDIGLAVAKLNGRVPDEGRRVNKKCEEVFYVLKGRAWFCLGDDVFEVEESDVVHVPAGKAFHYVVSSMEVVIPTSPAFYPEQWSLVSE